jgi:flotillin
MTAVRSPPSTGGGATGQAVLAEQAQVAECNAELREAQLQAEAAATCNRIALDQAVIARLPELVRAAAQGANVTVLNGAEGLDETVASLAAQGATILQTVLDGLGYRGTTGS